MSTIDHVGCRCGKVNTLRELYDSMPPGEKAEFIKSVKACVECERLRNVVNDTSNYAQFQMTQAELNELISIAEKPELEAAELSGKFWVRLSQRYKFIPQSATAATDLIDPTIFYALPTTRKS